MSSFNKRLGHRILTTADLPSATKNIKGVIVKELDTITDMDFQHISSSGNNNISLTKRTTLIVVTSTSLPNNIILPNPSLHVGYTVIVKYSAPVTINGISVSTVPGSLINVFNPGAVTLPKSSDTPLRFRAVESSASIFSWEVI